MSVKEKLIDIFIEFAWDIVLQSELTNIEKVRILSNVIYDDIPDIEKLDEAGVW